MEKDLEKIRHSASHVLAQAVLEFYPEAKLAIGPAIEDGFYYDFDLGNQTFSPDDLVKLEKKMKQIIKQNQKFEKYEEKIDEAIKYLKNKKQPYKVEMAEELKKEGEKKLGFYRMVMPDGKKKFVDLCVGPHVHSTKEIGAVKLLKTAGAYWRGDEKNKMLQRIYGTAFSNESELKEYLNLLAEAEKRDHKKLGVQLDLFSFHEEGPGFPFFHDKGTFIWNKLVEFMREEMRKRNYQENKTPIILNKSLWLQSGHWDHYKENMYFTDIDDQEFAVKPMNCPGNLLVYKTKLHSYRELPIRAGEFGLVHRHEKSGVLNGLFRVRTFTQDDAHVFCMESQLEEEIIALIDFIDFIYKTFGFDYKVELSTRPEKAMGSKQIWDKAEAALEQALKKKKINYQLNPGDGAFYGPKIDYHLKDSIGRTWQCGTIQLDFSMPEKFNLEYTTSDGKKARPVMLHRAIYGSIERFLGILVEHYAGAFPIWLAPVQVAIIPVGGDYVKDSQKIADGMKEVGIRVFIDDANETVGNKIRKSVKEKIPYVIVIGEKEIKNKNLSIRYRGSDKVEELPNEKFIEKVIKENVERK